MRTAGPFTQVTTLTSHKVATSKLALGTGEIIAILLGLIITIGIIVLVIVFILIRKIKGKDDPLFVRDHDNIRTQKSSSFAYQGKGTIFSDFVN